MSWLREILDIALHKDQWVDPAVQDAINSARRQPPHDGASWDASELKTLSILDDLDVENDSPIEGKFGYHIVCCTHCNTICKLPYTDGTLAEVKLVDQLNNWSISSEHGVECPACYRRRDSCMTCGGQGIMCPDCRNKQRI